MNFSIILALVCAHTAAATYRCPANSGAADIEPLVFGYKVQQLLNRYYMSIPVNDSFFDGMPMADFKGMNGMTNAQNTVANVKGLAKQAMLGSEAVKMAAMMSMNNSNISPKKMPEECDYSFPSTPDGMTHLKHLFFLEASMCGAFIGLADYVQSPEAAFLMARMSAEHGIHASALRAKMQDIGFMDNSTSLTPAFTPDTVVMESDDEEVGKLGKWLNGCATALRAPCAGTVEIGPMLADLTNQAGVDSCDQNGSGGAVATRTGGMNTTQSMPSNVAVTAAADHQVPVGGLAAVAAVVFAALLF